MSSLKATVIVPTSIDRGALLPYSVGSVLAQTVRELEVFIIGDGVHEVTREAARALERQDSRVRFFDHPKGPRRGEIYRHQALEKARGEIVCYLCDRDLYWPGHVAEMGRLLEEADYAHTLIFKMRPDGIGPPKAFDLGHSGDRARMARSRTGVPLSFGGHTLAIYRRLPQGWCTTPAGHSTDVFMAQRFMRQAGCRMASGLQPTVLNFHRGIHPGWSTAQRLPEVSEWARRLADPAGRDQLAQQIGRAGQLQRLAQSRVLAHPVVIGGAPLSWRTPLLPFQWFKETVASQVLTRPDNPAARQLRRWWRRWKGKPAL